MNHSAINDPAAILEHTGWLRSLARQLVADPNTADDVVQSTLIAAMAWEGTPRESMRNWLAGVARNVARQIRRGETRRSVRESIAAVPESIPSSEEMVELVETQRWLASQVLELEEPYRSTIYLRYLEELAPVDIASRLGIPSSTVRVRLKRGLALLRERLEESNTKAEGHWSLGLLPLLKPTRGGTIGLAGPALPAWLETLFGLEPSTKAAGLVALTLASIATVHYAPEIFPEHQSQTLALAPEALPSDQEQADSRRELLGTRRSEPAGLADESSEALITVGTAGVLSGRIFDGLGQPASGALVTAVQAHTRTPQALVFAAKHEFERQVRADAHGRYQIRVKSDHPHLVRALYPDWAPGESTIVFAGEMQDLHLERGQALEISVRDLQQQLPVPSARVRVRSIEPFRMPLAWEFESETDEQGRVTFPHLPVGPYELVVEKQDFAVSKSTGQLSFGTDAEQTVQLVAAITLTGIVIDEKTREPIVDALVQSPISETRTDHRGEFTLTGLDPRAAIVPCIAVYADDYPPAAEYLNVGAAGPKPHLTFEMKQWVRLHGRVIDDVGRPVGHQVVSFAGRFSPNADRAQRHDGELLTDADGRFVMPIHYRAQYSISAKMPGYAPASVRVRQFDPTVTRIDLEDLVLRPPGSIAGKVLGRTFNRVLPDTIQVDLLLEGNFRSTSMVQVERISITPAGEFSVAGLGPGTYGLTLLAARQDSSKTDALVRRTVKVEAGEAVTGITLAPVTPISGVVLDPNGRPVHRAGVTVRREPDGDMIAFEITDREGLFEMTPEGDGPFIVTAADRGFEFGPQQQAEIYPGMSGLRFLLQPRQTNFWIKGRLIDHQGKPIVGIHLRLVVDKDGTNLSCEAEMDSDGNFAFRNLDDQLYSIHATDPRANYKFTSVYAIPTNGALVEIQMDRRE